MTAKEESDRDVVELDYAQIKPMDDWLDAMRKSDTKLSGYSGGLSHSEETVIDMMINKFPDILNEVGNEDIKAKHTAKKALRATKP